MKHIAMPEWGAYVTPEGYGYGIGTVPGRKCIQIYAVGPGWIRTIAHIRKDEDAVKFMEFLEMASGLKRRQVEVVK